MFSIANSRKVGELTFKTAKGIPVRLVPGRELTLAVEELNDGLLRVMIGKGSHYRVRADSEEAQAMIDKAGLRKQKQNGSPLVHGSTEPPNYSAGRDALVEVRDDFSPKKEKKENETPPSSAPAPAPEVKKGVFIKEVAPEKSALELLIEKAPEMPFTDFRASAKEELGDDFPSGSPGRQALIELLKAKLQPKE